MLHFTDQDLHSGLKGKTIIRQWLKAIVEERGYVLGEVNIIFCSDSYILSLNKSSLGHDYYTDIITFDYCQGNIVSGDLFISLDTVCANSKTYRQKFSPAFVCELMRVMVHGLLHLSGEDDTTPYKQRKMRRAENLSLEKLLSDFDYGRVSIGYNN